MPSRSLERLVLSRNPSGSGSGQQPAAAASNYSEDRPIRARGYYDLSFFQSEMDMERHGGGPMAVVPPHVAHFYTQFTSDAVSDEEFRREFSYERLVSLDEEMLGRGSSRQQCGGLTAVQMCTLLDISRGLHIDCPICQETSTPTEKIVSLRQCRHAFHARCLRTWFAAHRTCPLCRVDVTDGPQQ